MSSPIQAECPWSLGQRAGVMTKTLVLAAILAAGFVERDLQAVAQEASNKPHETKAADDHNSAGLADAVLTTRELAKSRPVPFKKIEALASQAEETGNPGRIYAVVAATCYEHGSPAQTIHWARTALQHPLAPVDRLRMFQYWIDAKGPPSEDANRSAPRVSVLPALLGFVEAGNFRVYAEDLALTDAPAPLLNMFDESSEEEGDEVTWTLLDPPTKIIDPRNGLIRAVAGENQDLKQALEKFILTKGLVDGTTTNLKLPSWVLEGLPVACTFNVDYRKFWPDVGPVVDAMIGEEGTFDDVMKGVKEDPQGPNVDFDRDLIPYLGRQTTIAFDYRDSILGHGERLLLAIELLDAEKVATFLEKIYAGDTDIRHIVEPDAEFWSLEVPVLGGGTAQRAYCVAHDHLFCADLDLLRETLERFE